MAKPAVLLAALACGACVLSASAKIFVFKADKCNTNFNTDANFQDAQGKAVAAPVSSPRAWWPRTFGSSLHFADAVRQTPQRSALRADRVHTDSAS